MSHLAKIALLTAGPLAFALACVTPTDPPLPEGALVRSLLGAPLYAPPIDESLRAELEARLAEPADDVDALIRRGRTLSSLGRFGEAMDAFGAAIERAPDDPRPWRFRGHRFITLRDFDRAVADLERAAERIEGREDEWEPSTVPNARGVPLDTLHENVWYHLALAHYLRGEFEAALADWRRCRQTVRNDDGRAMCAYWIASAASRAAAERAARGRAAEAAALRAEADAALAAVHEEMDIVEYSAYHRLALLWKGRLEAGALLEEARGTGVDGVDFATLGYGIANWHLCHGDSALARRLFAEIEAGASWHAFGHIAAEAELARAHHSK